MNNFTNYEVWFITGSQHLYGADVLKQVKVNSKIIAKSFHKAKSIPIKIKFKALLTSPEEIKKLCQSANQNDQCIGLIAWMHTCLLYTSPSPRDQRGSRMPSSA